MASGYIYGLTNRSIRLRETRRTLKNANWSDVQGKRLREAKDNAKQAPEESETRGGTSGGESQVVVSEGGLSSHCAQAAVDLLVCNNDTTTTECSIDPILMNSDARHFEHCPSISAVHTIVSPSPSQPHFPMTVFSALYINGQILGLSCSTTVPGRSPSVGPVVPVPLHPTELQLVTIHPLWIDRFPCPKVRNNIISLCGIMDEEEFIKDIFLMPSFTLEPGRMPWDPRAWKIEKCFAEKWGYLFV